MKLNFCYTKLTTLSVVLNKLRRCYLTVADCGDKKTIVVLIIFHPFLTPLSGVWSFHKQVSGWEQCKCLLPALQGRSQSCLSLFLVHPWAYACMYLVKEVLPKELRTGAVLLVRHDLCRLALFL